MIPSRLLVLSSGRGLSPGCSRQQGVVAVFVAIGMVALLAMAGLALDAGHLMLNKGRIQNTVDAAALAAAKKLDETHDTLAADQAARQIFQQNANGAGNGELADAYNGGAGDISVTVQFSSSLYPFAPGTYDPGVTPDGYVRVRATNFSMPSWFISLLGISSMTTQASAVSGPSPTFTLDDQVCDLAPMMVCGAQEAGTFFGYELNDVQILKTSTNNGQFEVGPGNFQLVRLDGNSGGADVREAMAGGANQCLSSQNEIPTEPGNTVGPVVQGLNTRFGEYHGPMKSYTEEYPPDVQTTANSSEIEKDIDSGVITVTDAEGSVCDGSNYDTWECLSYQWSDYVVDQSQPPYDFEPP
ncbi:MAG: hypothetical protein HKM98_02400, partial [Gammaproteobacteria bacterium]|nr:hypothetical protein [Gammaproteobacteria bacterium]